MKITIWGARGSTPAPVKPDIVKQKVITALLSMGQLDEDARENLLAVIEQAGQLDASALDAYHKLSHKQRLVIDDYLSGLSPLAAATAGGNTPCIELRSGNNLFIIDAGSGIRELGMELMKGPCGKGEGVIHMFFSHPHWDHIQGFPFFRPAFIPGNQIFIYSVHNVELALRRQQEFISFPISLDYMQATKTFVRIDPNQVMEFGDVRIRNICNQHPGDAYSYRFEKSGKSFVYASDSSYPEGMDLRPYLNFFAEADLLIFDAQFTQRESDEKEDWGHSSSFVGVEMAQQAKVKTLALFHYDPTYSDHDLEKILDDTLKFQQNQYPNTPAVQVLIAQEGQTFDLTPPQTTQVQQVPGSKAAILKPTGIFDEHVSMRLREQLAKMVENELPAQLIIDMAAVEMLQVAGLRGLVKLRKEYQSTPMALAGPSINVLQLIELANYRDFFAIYPSIHVALNALKARETLNLPGQVFKNRYRIDTKIGEGRLGTVFKATDIQQNEDVAIKILSPSFSEGAIKQFLQQARQIVNLSHPNIVEVYDCDEDRGISFMVEEFIENHTLKEVAGKYKNQPLPLNLALSIAQNIIRALEYSHNHGVVHGDLKPKNVMMSNGQVKVSDFGLGRLEGGKALINIDVPLALGSGRYLAPEQVQGQPIDARTDLYALGVILYELFTGVSIFDGSEQELLEYHRSEPPPPPREINPRLSRSLEHMLLKLLEKDPAKRYSSARQVRHILNSMAIVTSRDRQQRTYPIERTPAPAGRQTELDSLVTLWSQMEQGQLVFISGETGVGKTRLAHELAIRLPDATVLAGHCPQMTGSPAYFPFVTALQAYFDTTPPQTAAQNVGRVLTQIQQLAPEALRHSLPVKAEAAPDSPDAPNNLEEIIEQATQKQPWLLIVDDLQWADANSLKLLEYLACRAQQLHLMLVAIFDSAGPKLNKGLANLLTKLSGLENYQLLTLENLEMPETRSLLESIWSQSVPPDLTTAIFNRTQGNPLFVECIANSLIDEEVVNWRDEKWYFGPVVEMGLPQTLDEAVTRRLNHLSRETQTLLTQAAILGPVFNFKDLYELSDLSEWDALESLDIAMERQLLRCAPGQQTLMFSHPLMQQILYQGLSALKQRLMHREAGEALERQHQPDTAKITEWLAYHFFEAGEIEKGLKYSIRAAQQADAVYAQQNGLYWYNNALDTIDQLNLDDVTQAQRFELLLAREQLYHAQGNRPAQAADLQQLQSLAQAINLPEQQAQVHLRQAMHKYAVDNYAEAATEAETGLIAARQAGDDVLGSESLIQLAAVALHFGQIDAAREHLYNAQNSAPNSNNQRTEARRLNGLGLLYHTLNDFTESEQYFRKAVALARLSGNRYGQALYLSNLGDVMLNRANYQQALAYQLQALTIAHFTNHQLNIARCRNRLAVIYGALGDFEQARKFVEQAQLLHHAIENEQGLAQDLLVLGNICLADEDYVSARDHIGQALEIFQHSKNKPRQVSAWLSLAMALEGLGHLAKAEHAYRQVILLTEEIGSRAGLLDAEAGVARCLLAEGQVAEARQTIEHCLAMMHSPEAGYHVIYPIRLYLSVAEVLRFDGPERAAEALQQGHQLLQNRLKALPDSRFQTSFLENVTDHKNLLKKMKRAA